MSEAALPARTARQIWAAPGSSHDRVVGVSRVALPVLIGVLAAFLVMAPLTMGGDVSFLLDKNKVEVAKERLRLQSATYRGEDGTGQPFALSAGAAVQRSASEPVVQLARLNAQLGLADGPARVTAERGRYHIDTQQLRVDGPLRFNAANGYRLDTRDSTIDIRTKQLQSGGKVTGTVPQGRFSANRMTADLDTHVVRLDGNATLRIVPGRTK